MTNEEKEFYTEVGAFLRRVRESKDISFQAVADALGVQKPFVQNIERGKKLSFWRFCQVCRVLGIELVRIDEELNLKGFGEL